MRCTLLSLFSCASMKKGKGFPLAAKAAVPQGTLRTWPERPCPAPSRPSRLLGLLGAPPGGGPSLRSGGAPKGPKHKKGKVFPLAAKAAVPQGTLRTWPERPCPAPFRASRFSDENLRPRLNPALKPFQAHRLVAVRLCREVLRRNHSTKKGNFPPQSTSSTAPRRGALRPPLGGRGKPPPLHPFGFPAHRLVAVLRSAREVLRRDLSTKRESFPPSPRRRRSPKGHCGHGRSSLT